MQYAIAFFVLLSLVSGGWIALDNYNDLKQANSELTLAKIKAERQLTQAKQEAQKESRALRSSADELALRLRQRDATVRNLAKELQNATKEVKACYALPAPASIVERVYGTAKDRGSGSN